MNDALHSTPRRFTVNFVDQGYAEADKLFQRYKIKANWQIMLRAYAQIWLFRRSHTLDRDVRILRIRVENFEAFIKEISEDVTFSVSEFLREIARECCDRNLVADIYRKYLHEVILVSQQCTVAEDGANLLMPAMDLITRDFIHEFLSEEMRTMLTDF